jgi:hypothetical protein
MFDWCRSARRGSRALLHHPQHLATPHLIVCSSCSPIPQIRANPKFTAPSTSCTGAWPDPHRPYTQCCLPLPCCRLLPGSRLASVREQYGMAVGACRLPRRGWRRRQVDHPRQRSREGDAAGWWPDGLGPQLQQSSALCTGAPPLLGHHTSIYATSTHPHRRGGCY